MTPPIEETLLQTGRVRRQGLEKVMWEGRAGQSQAPPPTRGGEGRMAWPSGIGSERLLGGMLLALIPGLSGRMSLDQPALDSGYTDLLRQQEPDGPHSHRGPGCHPTGLACTPRGRLVSRAGKTGLPAPPTPIHTRLEFEDSGGSQEQRFSSFPRTCGPRRAERLLVTVRNMA